MSALCWQTWCGHTARAVSHWRPLGLCESLEGRRGWFFRKGRAEAGECSRLIFLESIPRGKLKSLWKDPPCLMGRLSYKLLFSIAMLKYQRVMVITSNLWWMFQWLKLHGMCPGFAGNRFAKSSAETKKSHCKVSAMMWPQFDQILGCLESKQIWSSWRLVAP